MDSTTLPDAPPVPAGIDEVELIGLSNAQTPLLEPESSDEPDPPLDTAEQQGLLLDDDGNAPPQTNGADSALPSRPALRRGDSVPSPAPLHLPPPAPPAPAFGPPQTTDSLSLGQLRRLVKDMPQSVEPTPYAFVYEDASSLEEELEEWFSYNVEEQAMILKTLASFAQEWGSFHGLVFMNGSAYEDGGLDWASASEDQREEFIQSLLAGLKQEELMTRVRKLEALLYLLLGCWHETAGTELDPKEEDSLSDLDTKACEPTGRYRKSALQARCIRENVRTVLGCGDLQSIVDVLRTSCLKACGEDAITQDSSHEIREAERREVWCVMTSVYIILEVARIDEKEFEDLTIRGQILQLREPGLLFTLVDLVSRQRWDESIQLSLTKLCLLAWKAILVSFGGLLQAQEAKDSFVKDPEEEADVRGQPVITASPLDYHLFRQEIISKYPAYNPPPPLFPLEPENNSILPPLKNHPNKAAGNDVFGSGLGNMNGHNTSIFHQPVHIATPAPSPPPSPAGPGGKGGKKQNYQTNQMFPFLYPPLDETSNNLGGKGSTDLQDLLVGRKWEGSDIPTSILEAAELFSKRMRATRPMKQLWEERIQFMKYTRGWSGADEDGDIEELSLEPKEGDIKVPTSPGSVEERMQLVEDFYRRILPNLQSVIIVLVKAILSHVTVLVTQAASSNSLQNGFQYQENQNGAVPGKSETGANGRNGTNEQIEGMRTQEILSKAVSGILLLLLKWFKISHILKFEYVTQLLVDATYIPLILKLFQTQEIEKVVNFRCEQAELNFFYFCRSHSRIGIQEEEPHVEEDHVSDSDDAAPPPIRLRPVDAQLRDTEQTQGGQRTVPQPPEVDELGFPTNELPKEPITNYSWRAFFTAINLLRIMQKTCKNKAHRNLMLVSYKSSQFLRKNLKVPQPELRLYTLKLFKNQVPYCGRKWRQSNMRVITAVYLHIRPDLRDDWLAGSDVDAEVDESVPLEEALRRLTHWHNLKRYPESMGTRSGVLDDEQDFFRRELHKMDWGEEALDERQSDEHGWDGQSLDSW